MKKKNAVFSPEQRILLKMIGVGKPETIEYDVKEKIDWNKVFDYARLQGVSLFAFSNVSRYRKNMPSEVYQKWLSIAGAAMRINYTVYCEQQKILEMFDNKVDCIVLKGLSSALYYDSPEDRLMGDVDVLVAPSDLAKAHKILQENGYRKISSESRHDVLYKKGGVLIEVHYTLSGVPGGEYGKIIEEYMESVFETAKRSECAGQIFKAPDAAHHALVMILHVQHHIYYNVAWLKQILDWATFIKNTEKEPFWENEVLPLFKKTGLTVFAKALTKACGDYLGSPIPDWAADYKGDCSDIIAAAFEDGDGAIKGEGFVNADILLSSEYKKQNLFALSLKLIHKRVVEDHPSVKKGLFFLYPFFYFGKVAKYALRTVSGSGKRYKVINDCARRSKKIYDKFHIFENNKW